MRQLALRPHPRHVLDRIADRRQHVSGNEQRIAKLVFDLALVVGASALAVKRDEEEARLDLVAIGKAGNPDFAHGKRFGECDVLVHGGALPTLAAHLKAPSQTQTRRTHAAQSLGSYVSKYMQAVPKRNSDFWEGSAATAKKISAPVSIGEKLARLTQFTAPFRDAYPAGVLA